MKKKLNISLEKDKKLFNLIEKINPKIIKKLSEGAIIRSKELSWDSMTKKITDDYFKIIKDLK